MIYIILYQWGYTGIKNLFRKKYFEWYYQRRYTGMMIKNNKNRKMKKIIKKTIVTISMGVHKNDNKK